MKSISILHVDDNKNILETSASFLNQKHGLDVDTETNPEKAAQDLDLSSYDAIISDFEMPQMNGLEFLEEVRAEDEEVPFILFTGKGNEEIASDAISAGVTDYLQKGGSSEVYDILSNRIEKYVEKHRENQDLRTLFSDLPEPAVRYGYENNGGEPKEAIVTDVNEQFEEVFGYSKEEALGEHIDDLIVPDEKKEEAKEVDKQVQKGEYIDQILLRETLDGKKYFKLRNIETNGRGGWAIYADVDELVNRQE